MAVRAWALAGEGQRAVRARLRYVCEESALAAVRSDLVVEMPVAATLLVLAFWALGTW